MKKLLCLLLVLILSVSVLIACGNNVEETQKTDSTTVTTDDISSNATEGNPIKEDTKKDETSKKEADATKEESKKIEIKNDSNAEYFLIVGGTNDENIVYHKKDCPLLANKEIQGISWDMIVMLQFRHCAKCNPPKYEGYVE